MATEPHFVQYITDQLSAEETIATRKMFGEYALYNQGKVIGLICNNQLFIKPTEAGRTFINTITEASPYTGAKKYFLIEDQIDDRAWLTQLVQLTTHELPPPKPKKKRTKKRA